MYYHRNICLANITRVVIIKSDAGQLPKTTTTKLKKEFAMEVWKEFEQNEITHSIAHHLMAVDALLSRHGYCRVTDVARYLNITKGSASITLKHLKVRGYIEEDHNKFIHPTEKGKHTVRVVVAKRQIIIKFLSEVLRVEPEQAEIDACKIEHLVSSRTGKQLLYFVQFIMSGDGSTRDFLNAFRAYQHTPGDAENCNLCEDECQFLEICETGEL